MKEQKPIKEMSNKDFFALADRLGLFIKNPSAGTLIYGADRAYKVLSTLFNYESGAESVFFVCADEFEAKRYYRDFLKYLNEDEVLFYPQESLYFTFADSISVQNTALRARVIRSAAQKKKKLIVTGVWALCEKRLFPNSGDIIKLKSGKEAAFDETLKKIAAFGYSRQDVCEATGQFAVRGGIIDIFPLNEEKPLRIEFFGDEVDSIRRFDAQTQLSEKNIASAEIIPFEEVNIRSEELSEITNELKAENERMLKKLTGEQAEICRENSGRLFSRLSENPAEVARLFYMYTDKPLRTVTSLFSRLKIVFIEPAQIKKGYDTQKKAVMADFSELRLQNLAFKKQADIFLDFSEAISSFSACGYTALAAFAQSMPGFTFTGTENVGCTDFTASVADMNLTAKLIPNYLENEYKVIFLGENEGDREKLAAYLAAMSITVKKEITDFGVFWQKGKIHCGLDFSAKKVLLIPYDSGVKAAKKAKAPDEKKKEAFFSQIRPGDYVVHDNYGIGRYDGIFKITLDDTSKDYIKISYAKEDVLYVPPEQMDLLQKYIGPNENPPRLSNLGGGDWEGAKKKVSRAVKKLADEYLAMYAARAEKAGYAFSEDTAWQSEFEGEFRFEPTEGQLKASREIKNDMQQPRAMDRLLCGDVGYGKTEVAQRAAFKAVMDGKQVAVLVPTTILALQHYNNFIDRFSSYPIKIAMLSRFVTPQKTEKVLSDLAKGSVDIVIGTHKLLGKSVSFKDLGLLVIDEEQRFGVAHKDKLKLLKENVDTLTLSATPIPRTLHMSLIGVKDMSVLDTPPANKAEIKTYVMEKNDSVIAEAIKSELARDGQVFYLFNRVMGIERETERLKKLVPGARIEYAHGQMNEKSLEEIIMRFLNRETDVLVCTVIIENGVDFTNANTIIIDDADRLGLSQLYQLRGRVGRSDVQAYAYMMYKPDTVLTEVAAKRLAAIKEFTRFGSGFKIAMRDLQLRGAGEMLGANQHGHFANVGYEMYARLLTRAVNEIKGETLPEKKETELDLKLDMYISEEYIPSEEMRIEMYKAIAFIRNETDRDDIIDELIDRYGDIPESVNALVRAAFIKAKAINLGIKKIRSVNENVSFEFYPDAVIDPSALNEIGKTLRIKVKKSDSAEAVIILFVKDKALILDNCEEMVDKMLAFTAN